MTNNIPKRTLPLTPHPDHLRKEAKARLSTLKNRMPSLKLTKVQSILAREYGFPNWGLLQAEVARRSGQGRRLRHAVASVLAFRWLRTDSDLEHDGTIALFLAGLVTQVGFIAVALTGVAMVVVAGQHLPTTRLALLLQHII